MNTADIDSNIWFVYDGECPICGYAAQALRIKKEYGELNLLNAREATDHPLLNLINAQGLDLDESMVIYCEGQFYYGKSALQFMAKYSDTSGTFNIANKSLFWSGGIAALTYPWMRSVRNTMLSKLNKSKIDNLNLKASPIFEDIFGEDWDRLPSVLKKHYANRPYSEDRVTVEGVLDVNCRSYMRILRPFYRLLGGIPAVSEENVPVTVNFVSSPESKAFHFNRIFHFSGKKPYRFQSHMLQQSGGEVIEVMRFGLCWRTNFSWDGRKVCLRHKGYALKVFGHILPLPITALVGRGDANEIAVNAEQFDMDLTITHPIFGVVYSYTGRFKVTKEA